MGDYAQTPGSVLASPAAQRLQAIPLLPAPTLATSARPAINVAGGTILAGQPVYQDPTTFQFFPCQSNVDPKYKVVGIAENGASIGQPVSIVIYDPLFTPGCTLAKGDIPIVSATAGKICPSSDMASGWYVSTLGIAISTTQMILAPNRSDVAR